MILFFYTALKLTLPSPFGVRSLMILFFYTALKQYVPINGGSSGLMILFFYTALKRVKMDDVVRWSLMILFFYTALKHRGYNYLFCFNSSAISTNGKIKMQRIINICLPPILLHCSQTVLLLCVVTCLFDDPFLLHCSQTNQKGVANLKPFDDPFLLHCSQTTLFSSTSIRKCPL